VNDEQGIPIFLGDFLEN